MDYFEGHSRPFVEKITGAALKRGVDSKDSVRESVASTLRVLFSHYDPVDINLNLFKLADNPNISLKSAALEYITKYARESGKYFRSAGREWLVVDEELTRCRYEVEHHEAGAAPQR